MQPQINEKSKAIVRESQRSEYSIYDYCSIRAAEREREL